MLPFLDIFTSKLYGIFFDKYSKQKKSYIFIRLVTKKLLNFPFFLPFWWVCPLNDEICIRFQSKV